MDDELRLPSLNWLLDKAVLPGLSSTGTKATDTPRSPVTEVTTTVHFSRHRIFRTAELYILGATPFLQ